MPILTPRWIDFSSKKQLNKNKEAQIFMEPSQNVFVLAFKSPKEIILKFN